MLVFHVEARLKFSNIEYVEQRLDRLIARRLAALGGVSGEEAAEEHARVAEIEMSTLEAVVKAPVHAEPAEEEADVTCSDDANEETMVENEENVAPGALPTTVHALAVKYAQECPAEVELVVVVSGEGMHAVDVTAADSLRRMMLRLSPRVHVIFYGLRPGVRRVMKGRHGFHASAMKPCGSRRSSSSMSARPPKFSSMRFGRQLQRKTTMRASRVLV
jgi:hypothetical protein